VSTGTVRIDPFARMVAYMAQQTYRVIGRVRMGGTLVDLYDTKVAYTEMQGPPHSAVIGLLGKLMNPAPNNTVDYVYFELRDANNVVIASFEAQAVSDPVVLDAVGEYIVNISVVVTAPSAVAVTVR